MNELSPSLADSAAALRGIPAQRNPRLAAAQVARHHHWPARAAWSFVLVLNAALATHDFACKCPHAARSLRLCLTSKPAPIPGSPSAQLHVDFSFVLDQLSLVMLLVVTGVGFLIHIYSVGYMAR